MTPQELLALIADGEDTRRQFKRDFAHIDATAAWSEIELINDRRGNQFKVIVRRPTQRAEGVNLLLTHIQKKHGFDVAVRTER